MEFKNLLKSTLNRLTNQYLCLLKAASSEMALSDLQVDPRGEILILCKLHVFMMMHLKLGIFTAGGKMTTDNEPPAPLASSTSLSTLSTAVATQNLCASVNQLLDLIRTLRLSITIMGEDRVEEEELECFENSVAMEDIMKESSRIESELLDLLNNV